jgi:DNA helicase-2/ATP-dependent DNA helicase PcrA
MKELNPEQCEAVEHLEGPLLVFAGAGTGKTRVITYRITRLLEKGVLPENILAVTFTNKAADEMRNRVENLVPGKGKRVWISTFHSFCAKILRIETNPHFVIYDETDQKDLIKECIRELNLEEKKFRPGIFVDYISRAKDDLIDSDSYAILSLASNDPFRQIVALVYQKYQKKLAQANALDFGDLIMKAVFLLRDNPKICEKYQNRFHYLLIDEYQDTNRAQYLLAKYLAGKYKNICVVGDDDQAIYSWRGASVENLFQFERDYPETKIVKLERNYRSTPEILEVSWRVIKNNQYRKEKRLWTKKPAGNPIIYQELDDEIEEAKYVVSVIRDQLSVDRNYSLSHFAIFYRTNAQSRIFEDILRKEKIPYRIVGTVKFYERMEIKDILAYLKLIYNPLDNLSLKRIINRPARNIGKITLAKIEKYAQEKDISLWQALEEIEGVTTPGVSSLPLKAVDKIKDFVALIQMLILEKNKVTVKELAKKVLEKSGYQEELELEDTFEARLRIENLRELISAISEFEEQSEDKSLSTYLEQISLITSSETLEGPDEVVSTSGQKDAVTLMTLHLAKGLEFPVVFVTGLEEGLFPLGESIFDQEELEEERRLCYVGMTRAKDILYLTSTKMRKIYGYPRENVPSRFVDEAGLNAKSAKLAQRAQKDSFRVFSTPFAPFAKFKVGQRVKHPEFGEGKILQKEGSGENSKIKVRFANGQIKKLMVKYANLQKI